MQRVVLVGCGFMGRMHGNVYKILPDAELVACVDHRGEKGAKYGLDFGIPSYLTLEEALAAHECDVVDVCLPTHRHREFTEKGAAAGKHVFCEKPMALNLDDAQAMMDACSHAGKQLMIGHCIRFWPEYVLLKQLVDEGTLGKLLSLNLTRYGEFPSWASDNWMADENKTGGGAMDMHIHDTDFALFLLAKPSEISSFGTVDSRGCSQIFTTMQYPGCVVHLEGGWNLPPKTPFKMAFRAIFENGAVIMDGGPMTIYPSDREPYVPEFPKMEAAGGGNISDLGGYYRELEYFIGCLEDGSPVDRCRPESSKESLETVIEEIRQVKARR